MGDWADLEIERTEDLRRLPVPASEADLPSRVRWPYHAHLDRSTELGIERTCRRCGDEWPLDQFPASKDAWRGRLFTCNACRSERRRRWRKAVEAARQERAGKASRGGGEAARAPQGAGGASHG